MSSIDQELADEVARLVVIPPPYNKPGDDESIRELDRIAILLPPEYKKIVYEIAEKLFSKGANIGAYIGFAMVSGSHRDAVKDGYNSLRRDYVHYFKEKSMQTPPQPL